MLKPCFREIFVKKKLLFLLFLLAVVVCVLPVAQVSASSAHGHGVVSPFDQQNHSNALHCDLSRHYEIQVFCPHNITGNDKSKPVIASNCGGKTSAAIPAFGSYNANDFSSNTSHFDVDMVLITQSLFPLPSDTGFFLPSRLDRPPQSI